MDGRVAANRMKIQELQAKVCLYSWTFSSGFTKHLLDCVVGSGPDHCVGSERIPGGTVVPL